MFNNVGKKIKMIAKVLCWIGIVGYIIIALICFTTADSYYETGSLITMGFLCLFIGPALSWIISLFIYGYGELIDKENEIDQSLDVIKHRLSKFGNIKEKRSSEIERLYSEGLISEEEHQLLINKEK